MHMANIFTDLPKTLAAEQLQVLITGEHLRIERIVSIGQRSEDGFWYDQDEHEWVIVLRGEAKLCFEESDDIIHLGPGDHIHIPAHQRHRVEWTTPDEPTVWVAVFYED